MAFLGMCCGKGAVLPPAARPTTVQTPFNRRPRHLHLKGSSHSNDRSPSIIDMATKVATQTNVASSTSQESSQIPTDYIIRRTGSDTSSSETRTVPLVPRAASRVEDYGDGIYPYPAVHPRAAGAGPVPWWPTNWRRIPEYSPVNYELDLSERPIGENAIFSGLLFITLGGCGLISFYASVWRNTLGKINDRIFRYEVGGEL